MGGVVANDVVLEPSGLFQIKMDTFVTFEHFNLIISSKVETYLIGLSDTVGMLDRAV